MRDETAKIGLRNRSGLPLKLCFSLAVLSLTACIAAAITGYQALTDLRETEEKHARLIASLRQDMAQWAAKQPAAAGRKPEYDSRETYGNTPHRSEGTLAEFPDGNAVPSQSATARYHDEVMRLRHIVDALGLGELALEDGIDFRFLREMFDTQKEEQKRAAYLKRMMKQNQQLLREDELDYGKDIISLSESARSRGEDGRYDRSAEDAFYRMLDSYPNAYATAMLIADRALDSVFEDDLAAVEEYYDMLLSTGSVSFSNVMTSYDVEALPAIEYYLAERYAQQGRRSEAGNLADSIEANYPDSLILVSTENSKSMEPARRLTQSLRRDIEMK